MLFRMVQTSLRRVRQWRRLLCHLLRTSQSARYGGCHRRGHFLCLASHRPTSELDLSVMPLLSRMLPNASLREWSWHLQGAISKKRPKSLITRGFPPEIGMHFFSVCKCPVNKSMRSGTGAREPRHLRGARKTEKHSNRIVDVDKEMIDIKGFSEMRADCLHAEALGRVMAGREKRHAALRRRVKSGLGDFAGKEHVGARVDGRVEEALRRARAPCHAAQLPVGIAEHERRAPERLLDLRGEVRERDRHGQRGHPAEILLAEPLLADPAELGAELRVIAELRVAVERQMVGKQVEVVREQCLQATIFAPRDLRRLVLPEVAVMDQHGVGAPLERGFQKGQRGGHAGRDLLHAPPPFHLQPIRAVVLEPPGFQKIVQIQFQFDPIHIIL
ncbi:hypothetical protein PT2222_210077 [Paraburkholderia tropica]